MSCLVWGVEQELGYSRFIQRWAQDLSITGYIEHIAADRLEIVAEGHPQDLERLLHWVRQGLGRGQVTDVQVEWSEATGTQDFYIY